MNQQARQLWAFREKIQNGDFVVLPLKTRLGCVAVGRAAGPYQYRDIDGQSRHSRAVDWIRRDVPRAAFGQDIRYSFGAFSTVCRVKRDHADQRVAAVLEAGVDPGPSEDEATRRLATDQPLPPVKDMLEEFASTYFLDPPGTHRGNLVGNAHASFWERTRAEARQNWALVEEAQRAGKDITDLVLRKLLPHADTPHNRAEGGWIHIAPAITKDVKSWFENAAWTPASDWPRVADAIHRFFQRAQADPSALRDACAEFAASPYSKGIQSAFLSPILNALRPDEYLLVNSKSRRVLAHLTGERFPADRVEYPDANDALRKLVNELTPELQRLVPGHRPADVLDAFCHWFVRIKGYGPGRRRHEQLGEGSRRSATARPPTIRLDLTQRTDPQAAARVAAFILPDPEQRHTCLAIFAEAIELSSHYGGWRWAVTLRPQFMRLNVGCVLAMELGEKRVRIGLSLRDLPADVREALDHAADARKSVRLRSPAVLPIADFR